MTEAPRETWITWVALTTTILAVLAAIASLRAASYSTRVQIATTKEANQWAYYQSKSIKEHSYTLNRDILASVKLLETKNPKTQQYLTGKIKEYEGEIARYDKEKHEIKKIAEDIIKEQEVFKQKNGDFALAVIAAADRHHVLGGGRLDQKEDHVADGADIGWLGDLLLHFRVYPVRRGEKVR